MGRLKPRTVYWIEGYLNDVEKPYAARYFADLKGLFQDLQENTPQDAARDRDVVHQFKRLDRCTPEKFRAIWASDQTVGIILYGHGNPSGRFWLNSGQGFRAAPELDPTNLPQSGANLRGLAAIHCDSALQGPIWRSKIARKDAFIKTVSGRHLDGGKSESDETHQWINKKKAPYYAADIGGLPFLGRVTGALKRGGHISAFGVNNPEPASEGCRCGLGSGTPIRVTPTPGPAKIARRADRAADNLFAPYLQIPPVGTQAGQFTMHQIRSGDRVVNLAEDFGYRDRRRFVMDVALLNPGLDVRRLRPGQRVRIPTMIGEVNPVSPSGSNLPLHPDRTPAGAELVTPPPGHSVMDDISAELDRASPTARSRTARLGTNPTGFTRQEASGRPRIAGSGGAGSTTGGAATQLVHVGRVLDRPRWAPTSITSAGSGGAAAGAVIGTLPLGGIGAGMSAAAAGTASGALGAVRRNSHLSTPRNAASADRPLRFFTRR